MIHISPNHNQYDSIANANEMVRKRGQLSNGGNGEILDSNYTFVDKKYN